MVLRADIRGKHKSVSLMLGRSKEKFFVSEKQAITDAIHQQVAKDLFNQTWTLLDKTDRSEEEDDLMIHSSHASRYHWGQIGTPLEFERGEWQISRVYAVLDRSEPALYHARRCLEICKANNIGDFDLAFAYEAMARAYSVAKNNDESERYLILAKAACIEIEDKGNSEYVLSELDTIQRN
jgi:hypothetical protein